MRLYKEEKEFIESEISKKCEEAFDLTKVNQDMINAFKESKKYAKIYNAISSLISTEPEVNVSFGYVSIESKGNGISFNLSISVDKLSGLGSRYSSVFSKYDNETSAVLTKKFLETKTPVEEDRYNTLQGIIDELSAYFINRASEKITADFNLLRNLK